MDMKNDEIVMRYRQAKHKGEQIKILAELNACTVDDILAVLVEHGGYQLQRISRAIGAARKDAAPAKKRSAPAEPKPDNAEQVLAVQEEKQPIISQSEQPIDRRLLDSAFDIIRAELEDIKRQQAKLDMRKAELLQSLRDMFGEISA